MGKLLDWIVDKTMWVDDPEWGLFMGLLTGLGIILTTTAGTVFGFALVAWLLKA